MLLDGSNILVANMASRAITRTILEFRTEARVARLMKAGMSRSRAIAAAAPIRPVVRVLFNPASHYSYFVLAGLVLIALQQVTRMGAAVSLSLDSEPHNRSELAAIGGGTLTLLTSKLCATAVAVLPIAYIAIRLPFDVFGSPFRGSWVVAYTVLTLFVLMQILVGYGVSGMCGSAAFSLQLLLFASVPLFTLAGFTWPTYAMPPVVQIASELIPLTHITDLFRKMALMGAEPSSLWPHLMVLLAWLPVCAGCAYWGVKRQTRQA